MKKIAVLITTFLLAASFSFAQTQQKKDEKQTKKETKTEMTTTKVIHHCNPGGTTCTCGDNCKPGCCVTVAENAKPAGKGTKAAPATKAAPSKKEPEKAKTEKTENPPKSK